MPLSNDVTVKPSMGGGGGDLIPEGVHDVEINDITYIPGEENQFSNKPQLKLRFKLLEKGQEELSLVSWVSMTLNPGWDAGSPSNLYKIAVAVMGEEPDIEAEFFPNVLIGGKMKVVVENRKTKAGKEVSKITNYLKAGATSTIKAAVAKEDASVAAKKEEESDVPF